MIVMIVRMNCMIIIMVIVVIVVVIVIVIVGRQDPSSTSTAQCHNFNDRVRVISLSFCELGPKSVRGLEPSVPSRYR